MLHNLVHRRYIVFVYLVYIVRHKRIDKLGFSDITLMSIRYKKRYYQHIFHTQMNRDYRTTTIDRFHLGMIRGRLNYQHHSR